MFLKKKAHNLFSKSIKLALKGVKGSVTATEVAKNENEPAQVETTVAEDVSKPKKTVKTRKVNADELV